MNDKQRELFIMVVDEGSFSKAEEKAFMSKQAIIKQINALEKEVGATLLIRTPQGIRVTPAGKELYHGICKINSYHKELIEKIRSQPEKPMIRLANVEHHTILEPVNRLFSVTHTDIQIVRYYFSDTHEQSLVEAGKIDIAEQRRPQRPLKEEFVYEPLIEVPYLCVINPSHKLAQKDLVSVSDLIDEQVFMDEVSEESSFYSKFKDLSHLTMKLVSRQETMSRKMKWVHEICSKGGIFISPAPFLKTIEEYTVIPLDIPCTKEYGIIHAKILPSHMEEYIQFAKKYYAQK